MWFAAKEAVEKKAMEKGRLMGLAEGREEGRREERRRIGQALERQGVNITPEIARILDDKAVPTVFGPCRRRCRRRGNGR